MNKNVIDQVSLHCKTAQPILDLAMHTSYENSSSTIGHALVALSVHVFMHLAFKTALFLLSHSTKIVLNSLLAKAVGVTCISRVGHLHSDILEDNGRPKRLGDYISFSNLFDLASTDQCDINPPNARSTSL